MNTTSERKDYIHGAVIRIQNQLNRMSGTTTLEVEDGCVEQILKEAAQLQKNLDIESKRTHLHKDQESEELKERMRHWSNPLRKL